MTEEHAKLPRSPVEDRQNDPGERHHPIVLPDRVRAGSLHTQTRELRQADCPKENKQHHSADSELSARRAARSLQNQCPKKKTTRNPIIRAGNALTILLPRRLAESGSADVTPVQYTATFSVLFTLRVSDRARREGVDPRFPHAEREGHHSDLRPYREWAQHRESTTPGDGEIFWQHETSAPKEHGSPQPRATPP